MTQPAEGGPPPQGAAIGKHAGAHAHGHAPMASPRPRASAQQGSQASPRELFHALRQAHPSVTQPKHAHGKDGSSDEEDAEWGDAAAALREQQLQQLRKAQEEQLRQRLEHRVGKTVPLLSPRQHHDAHTPARHAWQQQQEQQHAHARQSPALGLAHGPGDAGGYAIPSDPAAAPRASPTPYGPYPGPHPPPPPAELQHLQHGHYPPLPAGHEGHVAGPLLLPAPAQGDTLALAHTQHPTPHPGAAQSTAALPLEVDQDNNPNYYEDFGDISQHSLMRRAAIRTVCNADFELLVTLIIFGNCVTLTLYDPMQPDNSPHNKALFWTELSLNIFYTFEAAIRMTAFGGPRGYFSQPWNQFDFTMVVLGYISILPISSDGNESAVRALRALRALRVLRTITRFESLRAVVVCFLEAVPLLSAAFFLVMAYLLLFAVASVQMYTNVFHNICAQTVSVPLPSGVIVNRTVFEDSGDDEDMFGCSSPEKSGWWFRECPDNYSCMVTPSPTSVNCPGFDNTGVAFLTNFQVMTLTGWSFIMYRTIDNTSPFAGIYFIALVVIGAYLLINLFLAVLKTKFAKAQTIFQEKKKAKGKSSKSHNTLQKLFHSAKGKISEISSKHSQASILSAKLQSETSKRLASQLDREPPAPAAGNLGSGRTGRTGSGKPVAEGTQQEDALIVGGPAKAGMLDQGAAVSPGMPAVKTPGKKKARVARFAGDDGDSDTDRDADKQAGQLATGAHSPHGAVVLARPRSADGPAPTSPPGAAPSPGALGPMGLVGPGGAVGPQAPANAAMAMDFMSSEEFDEFVSDLPPFKRNMLQAQFRVRKFVMWPMFDNFFLLAIIVNTVLLAVDYHAAPPSYQLALWNANVALTAVFTFEMVTKLFGLGFWDYVRDGFNVFDMLVVAMSLSEVIVVTVLGPESLQGTSALRILRALRVIRLFKMFKYITSLRRIGEVLMTSFTSFASIMVLLCIFWLLFSIIGLHVFGALPLEDAHFMGYPNFDTFLNSLVSTFNILNMENYQNQWGAVARVSGWGTGAFYVVWILIGKYICVSLFLAVMLEAFEAKYDAAGGGGGTNITGMSGFGSRMSGMLSSVRSKLSAGGSVRERSPPTSPRRAAKPPLSPSPAPAKVADVATTAAATAAPDGARSGVSRVPLLQLHRGSILPGPGSEHARLPLSDAPSVRSHTPHGSGTRGEAPKRSEAVPQVEAVKASMDSSSVGGIGSYGSPRKLVLPSTSARHGQAAAVGEAWEGGQGVCSCGTPLLSSGRLCTTCQQGRVQGGQHPAPGPLGEGVESGDADPAAVGHSRRGSSVDMGVASGMPLGREASGAPPPLSSRRASMEWRPIPGANVSGGSGSSTPRSVELGLAAWLGTPRSNRRISAVAPAPPPKPDPSAPPPRELKGQQAHSADTEDFDPDMAEYLGAVAAPRRGSTASVANTRDATARRASRVSGATGGGMEDTLAFLQAELAGSAVVRPAGPAPPDTPWETSAMPDEVSSAALDRRAATAEPHAARARLPAGVSGSGAPVMRSVELLDDALDNALLNLAAFHPRHDALQQQSRNAKAAARRHSVDVPGGFPKERTLMPSMSASTRALAGAPAPLPAAMPSSTGSQSPTSVAGLSPMSVPARTGPALFIPTLDLSAVQAAAAAQQARQQQQQGAMAAALGSSRRSSADGALSSHRRRQQQMAAAAADVPVPLRRSVSGSVRSQADGLSSSVRPPTGNRPGHAAPAAGAEGRGVTGRGETHGTLDSKPHAGSGADAHADASSSGGGAEPGAESGASLGKTGGAAARLPSQGRTDGGTDVQRQLLPSTSSTMNMDSAKDMHGSDFAIPAHSHSRLAAGDATAQQAAAAGGMSSEVSEQSSSDLPTWRGPAGRQTSATRHAALLHDSPKTTAHDSPKGVKSAALSSDSSPTTAVADKPWLLDECDVRKPSGTEVGICPEATDKDTAKEASTSRDGSKDGPKRSASSGFDDDDEDDEERDASASAETKPQRKRMTAEERFRRRQARRNGAIPIEGTGLSLWYFDEDHPGRVAVYNFVTNPYFDYALLVIITLNCVAMAMEGPMWAPGSTMAQALYWCDVGFTILFGIEAAIKMFAFTFVAYIKDITNQVDFAIVVVSVLVIALEAILADAAAIQGLRALRAIKPLRMLTRSPGMRMVFKSIAMSLAAMGNVSIVLLIFFLIFAILGTQLFMGLLYSCNDGSVANMNECIGTYIDPISRVNTTREWSNTWPNFDNVGNSLLVCFMLATLNGYTTVMINTMNAPTMYGEQPRWMINKGAFFFYVGFVFVVAFALLNLYIGVIFSQFTKIRLAGTGSAFLTNDQQEWAELTKMVFKLKPSEKAQRPKNKLRAVCYSIATSHNFESFVLVVILMNMGVLASASYNQGASHIRLTEQLNYFFCAVYFLEAIVKITGLGWRMYWKDGWNKFDFVLVLLAVLDLAISNLAVSFIRALRVLRAQKLLRLLRNSSLPQVVRAANNIRSLANVLLAAIPGFGNVLALIGLVLFMYSYVGVILFGTLIWNVGINEHTNFNNFGNALLLLIRVATLDNWWDILLDTMATPENSLCTKEAGNCGTYAALFYFISYIIIVTIILLNLFTAVIIETFEKTHNQEDWKLSPQSLETFVQLWSQYDDGSGTITPRDLEDLLMHLDPPLGLGLEVNSKDVLRFVYDLDIPLVNGRVPFHKTAYELVKRVSQSKIPDGEVKEQLDKLMGRFFHNLKEEELLNFSTAVVVSRVQKRWRARTRAIKLRRRKDWRSSRDISAGAPQLSLTALNDNWESLVQKYKDYKQGQRLLWEIEDKKGSNPLEQRWRFIPALHPKAAEMEKDAWRGAKRLLRGIIGIGRPKLLSTPAAIDEDKPLLSSRRGSKGN